MSQYDTTYLTVVLIGMISEEVFLLSKKGPSVVGDLRLAVDWESLLWAVSVSGGGICFERSTLPNVRGRLSMPFSYRIVRVLSRLKILSMALSSQLLLSNVRRRMYNFDFY